MVIGPEDIEKPTKEEIGEVNRILEIIDDVLMQSDPVENDRLGIGRELYIIALNEEIPAKVKDTVIAIYKALGWNVRYVLPFEEGGERFGFTTPEDMKRLTRGERLLVSELEILIDELLATKKDVTWFHLETELEGRLSEKVIKETIRRYQKKQPEVKLHLDLVWGKGNWFTKITAEER